MSEMSSTRRRWMQFSLRALFAIMLLAALVMAWLAVVLKRVHTQREAVERVTSLGGEVTYDYSFYWDRWPDEPTPLGPKLVRWAIGDDVYARVKVVAFFSRPISDEDLAVVNHFPTIEMLHGTIRAPGVQRISSTIRLRGLSLEDSTITGSQIVASPVTRGLTHLVLGPKIGDATVAGLDKLQRLERLVINGADVTDAGLQHIAAIHALRSLDVMDCAAITDAGISHLKGLRDLRSLRLWDLPVTDAGLEVLSGLPQLESLYLFQLSITDNGLSHLAELKQLKELDLHNDSTTDAGLAHLRGLRSLERLSLGRGFTSKGVQELKRSLPKCRIEYENANGNVLTLP